MIRANRAFTLVEMLLVVALIVLLISLLLPAMSKARSEMDMTVCATHMSAWGEGVISYSLDNVQHFPDNRNTGVTPDLSPGGQHVSWNSSVVQRFFREYLQPLSEAAKTDELDLLNCPTQKWHQINDVGLGGGLVGYFYLPHRTPTNINYTHADGGLGNYWVSKKRVGGHHSYAPILIDMKQYGKHNSSWFWDSATPYSSHVRADGTPFAQNMLFESGEVNRYDADEVKLGSEMGGWLMYYDPF